MCLSCFCPAPVCVVFWGFFLVEMNVNLMQSAPSMRHLICAATVVCKNPLCAETALTLPSLRPLLTQRDSTLTESLFCFIPNISVSSRGPEGLFLYNRTARTVAPAVCSSQGTFWIQGNTTSRVFSIVLNSNSLFPAEGKIVYCWYNMSANRKQHVSRTSHNSSCNCKQFKKKKKKFSMHVCLCIRRSVQ